ncbi:hypothetical protein J2128_001345 [Methanomicrobium sp. W14]|uniref:hypothetical protein n=1 Tax=Methanomicrobium sp. W14 TaxID=2817839 RepID=UPI001AE9FB73|nr:hypothetical protein [Methanomicrobium sp. W14]MBP2133391.1 hypothetical protein [Methanomicrobium sp. W14]
MIYITKNEIPYPTETYQEFYKRAPKHIKAKLEEIKKRKKEYFLPSKREDLSEEIQTDTNHHELMKLCVKGFAQTRLSQNSGYEFYFAEPLIELASYDFEFASQELGDKSFDLFLYNEKENRCIFIECKSSVDKANKILEEIENSKQNVLKNIDYLSEIVDIKLDPSRFEYVAAVYDIDSDKILKSLTDKKNKGKYNTKLWVYKPHSNVIQLYHNHKHDNKILTEFLLKGFGNSEARSRFDLSCCITTHKFRQIIILIISECYNNNYQLDKEDPKIISILDIEKIMCKKISMGISGDDKRKFIKQRLQGIIKYGIKYQLFQKIGNDRIRLLCQGEKLDVVVKNIKEKYIKNWTDAKAEKASYPAAIDEYRKEIRDFGEQKLLNDWFDDKSLK